MAETVRCDSFEVWVFPPNTIEHVIDMDDTFWIAVLIFEEQTFCAVFFPHFQNFYSLRVQRDCSGTLVCFWGLEYRFVIFALSERFIDF